MAVGAGKCYGADEPIEALRRLRRWPLKWSHLKFSAESAGNLLLSTLYYSLLLSTTLYY